MAEQQNWAECPESFNRMNSKSGKGTWIVKRVMIFVNRIDGWMVESVVLPVGPGVSPHGGDEDFKCIIGVAAEEGSFFYSLLESDRVAVSLPGDRPGAKCRNNVRAD